MDIDNSSGMQEWMQLMEKHKENLRSAEARKGEKPRDRKTRSQLIHIQIVAQATKEMRAQGSIYSLIYQSFVPPPYLPSVRSITDMRKIYIKDLELQVHHRGSYLILRAATPAYVLTAVSAVMEDEKDAGVVLQLYHQKDYVSRPLAQAIEPGNICIIKEPYYKVGNDGEYGVRVDHVSDVIWLMPDADEVPDAWKSQLSEIQDAEKLRIAGNTEFKAGNLHAALVKYGAIPEGHE